MKKLKLIVLFVIIMFPGFQTYTKAQETEITDTKITIKKMRLPILPDEKNSKYYSLKDEVAIIISNVMKKLRLYDVLVGIYIDSTLENENSTLTKEKILTYKQIKEFNEAIVVTATNITQKGIPPGEEETYFSLKRPVQKKSPSKNEEAYSNNICTEITVLSDFVNIKTGEFIGSFNIKATHIGGSRKKSKARALKTLKKKVMYELKRIYWFSSDIVATKNGKITLPVGTGRGLRKGMIFEIVEPERIWTVDDEEFIVLGGSAGFASVADTAKDSSSLKILRQWKDHYAGSWAVEHPQPIFGIYFNYVLPSTDSYSNFGVHFHAAPIHNFDWGLGMQIIRVIDSFNDKNFGFGFAGFGLWRFLNMSRIDLGGKLGIDLDIPFKKDDNGQRVHTVLFSTVIGISAEFALSLKSDLVLNTGYRFGVKSDKWEYSEDDNTLSAYWVNKSPEVANSGFMLSIGYKYYLF